MHSGHTTNNWVRISGRGSGVMVQARSRSGFAPLRSQGLRIGGPQTRHPAFTCPPRCTRPWAVRDGSGMLPRQVCCCRHVENQVGQCNVLVFTSPGMQRLPDRDSIGQDPNPAGELQVLQASMSGKARLLDKAYIAGDDVLPNVSVRIWAWQRLSSSSSPDRTSAASLNCSCRRGCAGG